MLRTEAESQGGVSLSPEKPAQLDSSVELSEGTTGKEETGRQILLRVSQREQNTDP